MSVIAEVEAIALSSMQDPDPENLDGGTETVVVRLTDEDGAVGIGEADAPPAAVRELVLMEDAHAWSRGLRSLLIGRDPVEVGALHDDLYARTIYHGRRGLGIHALSAVDIALHDLAGKQLGRPVYQLLGGARQASITPYVMLWPSVVPGRRKAELMDALADLFDRALALGFRAVKMAVFPGEVVSDRELIECIHEGRRLAGDDVTLMVDFGYRWSDWRDALWVLSRVEDCQVYLAEGTLHHDDLAGHAKLAHRVETRIAGGEMAATVFECREWLERGCVDVLQPDVNRCGGLTEARRIAELAALEGAMVIPHGWKTGITAAAVRHFQAATANVPYVHFPSNQLYDYPLPSGLTGPEPPIEKGSMALPTAPGLGIDLVEEVVAKYRVQ